LVEVTGGEPLVQKECLDLMKRLCDEGFDVMLETGGSLPIKDIDERVLIIMDLKCPSSKMEKKNLYENIDFLKPSDELKFVIGNREDYDWSKEIISKYDLKDKSEILFSVVFGELEPVSLVNWIIEDKLDVRYQLQMHKYIWHPETKGV
jgi:7-carboxy-7-deazaguanine synthase